MKRIEELTEEELLALDDEAFNRQVDYECALEGISLVPPHPGPVPVNTLPEPDTKIYKVCGVITTDPDHASAILEAATSKPLYKKESRNHRDPDYLKVVKPTDYGYPEINIEICHSPSQWESIKDDQAKYNELKKAYDDQMCLYNDAFEPRKEIICKLGDRLREAQNRNREKVRLRDEFTRYLDLAENNRTVAMNFLLKAKPHVATDYEALVQELCPGYGMPEVNAA